MKRILQAFRAGLLGSHHAAPGPKTHVPTAATVSGLLVGLYEDGSLLLGAEACFRLRPRMRKVGHDAIAIVSGQGPRPDRDPLLISYQGASETRYTGGYLRAGSTGWFHGLVRTCPSHRALSGSSPGHCPATRRRWTWRASRPAPSSTATTSPATGTSGRRSKRFACP